VRHHENLEAEIAGILEIAQTAALGANVEGKHDQRRRNPLTCPDMTVDELLIRLPLFRWPCVGANGCSISIANTKTF
jgi:hypothetical protein